MPKRSIFAILFMSVFLSAGPASATGEGAAASGGETLVGSICRLIDSSARAQGLPVSFLTRLIWQESNFQPNVSSPAGALGIAQFMPGTAGARGLADPFDPEAAIPKAASLLAELRQQFGNLGLAAAAYNAGPGRVAKWLANGGDLPIETQDYVSIVTRHPVDEWAAGAATKLNEDTVFPDSSCVQNIAAVRRSEPMLFAHSAFWAPWGVQISGSFNKEAALRAYQRARGAYASILGGIEPMIIGGLLRSRGFRAFYRVRAPAATRAEADALCAKLLKVGGACVVLRS
jgi:hypothetical protein